MQEPAEQAGRIPEELQWQSPQAIFAETDAYRALCISTAQLVTVLTDQGFGQNVVDKLMKELGKDPNALLTAKEWQSGFYASSLVSSEPPPSEDFHDLHLGGDGYAISDKAERGITVAQLQRVIKHIERRCGAESWANFVGVRLSTESVTMYDASRFVIKPATRAKHTSFVELIAEGRQAPLYFVSHWWGQQLASLVKCLAQHVIDRMLDSDDLVLSYTRGQAAAYWVCGASHRCTCTQSNCVDPHSSLDRLSASLTQRRRAPYINPPIYHQTKQVFLPILHISPSARLFHDRPYHRGSPLPI